MVTKPLRLNLYSEKVCRVWLQLGPRSEDFWIESVRVDAEIGEKPDWFLHEVSVAGWDEILNTTSCCDGYWQSGGRCDNSYLHWGLLNGVAPLQPFWMEFPRPTYLAYAGDWGTDYDVEYSWDIIERWPWEEAALIKTLDSWLKEASS